MINGQLKVSENKRFLANADGWAFFWLADTAWELLHCLTREEIEAYIKFRSKQGFNVVHTAIIAEFDGLREPNAYGRLPLMKNYSGQYDPSMPDLSGEYNYFDHLDFALLCAAGHDIHLALVPAWGDKFNCKWGIGPEAFTPDNAFSYGEFLGKRYKAFPNIIWLLGGDRPLEAPVHRDIVKNMANGLKSAGDTHLITFHPMGGRSSGEILHGEPWLDFNMIQSGHGEPVSKTAEMITADYNRLPVKPVVEGECNYGDHPINFNSKNGWFDATDVRRASYWAVFSGSFGITYGNHSVWSMDSAERVTPKGNHVTCPEYFLKSMEEAVKSPAAAQMTHLKNLILSKSFFDRAPANELLHERYEGANLQCATKGSGYLLVYCPNGLRTSVNLSDFISPVKASWFDPRTGEASTFGTFTADICAVFTPPDSGRNRDYVLIIEQ